MAGIHRQSYSYIRPVTPNLLDSGLGLAPGATLNVYLTGTGTLAALYTNAALSQVLANPFTTDINAFLSYYVDPSLGDVDEAYSGTGIVTPYTLSAVLALDPRVSSQGGSIGTLQTALTAETTAREAADLAIQTTGMAIPLGGSLSQAELNASAFSVIDAVEFTCPTLYSGAAGTVFATLMTLNAGTSVTAYLYDLTASANVGNSSAVTSTTPTLVSFSVTLTAGHNYVLQLLASNATNGVFGSGYLGIAA
jgi:hypothetical protein